MAFCRHSARARARGQGRAGRRKFAVSAGARARVQASACACACQEGGSTRRLRIRGPAVHEALEALDQALARLALELVGLLRLLHDGLHVLLGVVDDLGHVGHGLGVGLRVADADREAAVQQPVVDHLLAVVDEVARHLRAHVVHDDVQQALHLVAELVLGHDAHEVLALDDEHAVVARPAVGLARIELAVLVVHVGCEARDGLLARPQRVVLPRAARHGPHDGRRRDAPVPALHPQQHVEEDVLLDEDVALRHLARAKQRVLHDAHDRPVRGGRHD